MDWLFETVFGGENGCFGSWMHEPTMTSVLQAEHLRLKGLIRRLDREMERRGAALNAGGEIMQNHAKKGRMDQARRAAIEQHQNRQAFFRLGKQKDAVARVAAKVQEQVHAVAVDQSVAMLMRVLSVRMQIMTPEQFSRRLVQYEQLKDREALNEEQLEEFFSTAEGDDREDEADEEDRIVMQIFAEHGIVAPVGGKTKAATKLSQKQQQEQEPAAETLPATDVHTEPTDVEQALSDRLAALQRAPKVQ